MAFNDCELRQTRSTSSNARTPMWHQSFLHTANSDCVRLVRKRPFFVAVRQRLEAGSQ